MMDLSDEALVSRAQEGDSLAFEAIVGRHYGEVLARIRTILGNREDAMEIAQETFLRAHRSLDQIRDGSSLRGWLGRIGVRLALNRSARDRHRRMVSLDDLPPDAFATAAVQDPLDRIGRSHDLDLVRQEIDRLSPSQRTAFRLRFEEKMSFQEIAQWMGNKEATARVLYFQAIRRLRQALEVER